MGLRRLFVITAEKTETYTVRQEESPPLIKTFCEKCDREIRCLTLNQAVRITGLGARAIFRLVEAEELHCYETEEGHLLLCPNTLALFIQM
jgi:tRNA A22 N-methylase